MNKALIVILMAATLDAVGAGLIFPILPELLRELTHSGEIAILYGLLLAGYSGMAFLFAPVLGVLSDRIGRRPVLMLAMAGAVVDYLVMAIAPNLAILVVGRLAAGITAATLAVSTAYIADITEESQRARRFGLLYACFGLGFVVGPVLGGVLGEYWVRAPFLAAAVMNGVNLILAFYFLPESRTGDGRVFSWNQVNPFRPLGWALRFKEIRPLLLVYAGMAFVGTSYVTAWVLFAEDQFGWGMAIVGLSLAAYGVAQATAQALLTGPAAALLGNRGAVLAGLVMEVIALFVLSMAGHGWIAFALLPIFALGGIGEPALQSLLSSKVGQAHQGQLQGVLVSIASLMAALGPIFFATAYGLLRGEWPGAIWLIVAGLYVLIVPIILMGGQAWKLTNATKE